MRSSLAARRSRTLGTQAGRGVTVVQRVPICVLAAVSGATRANDFCEVKTYGMGGPNVASARSSARRINATIVTSPRPQALSSASVSLPMVRPSAQTDPTALLAARNRFYCSSPIILVRRSLRPAPRRWQVSARGYGCAASTRSSASRLCQRRCLLRLPGAFTPAPGCGRACEDPPHDAREPVHADRDPCPDQDRADVVGHPA
jgi:hypothetical protein